MAEKKRSALLPDLPTIDESGLPGFAVANWAGLLGPAGLDPKIVKKLHDEIVAILATPEMKERVKQLGYDMIESTPEQFAEELQCRHRAMGPCGQTGGSIGEIGGASIGAVERRRFLDQHALDVLPRRAEQECRQDWRVTPAMCGVSRSRRAASPSSLSNGLSAVGGSVE